MIKCSPENLAREKALYLYGSALAAGDFDTVSAVLKLAESDGQLAELLYELDQAHEETEVHPPLPEQDVVLVQRILRSCLPEYLPDSWPDSLTNSRADNTSAEQIPEVTVGEVVARLQADRAVPKSDQAASRRLQDSLVKIPLTPSRRSIQQLASSLGVSLSEKFWETFRETAILLGLRTSQQVSYAAARQQHSQSSYAAKKTSRGATDG